MAPLAMVALELMMQKVCIIGLDVYIYYDWGVGEGYERGCLGMNRSKVHAEDDMFTMAAGWGRYGTGAYGWYSRHILIGS